MRGAYYVAYGDNARAAARRSIDSLRRNNRLPVAVCAAEPLGVEDYFIHRRDDSFDPGARLAKIHMADLTPWESTAYLDADTMPKGDLTPGFEIVEDGWDLAIAISQNQAGPDWLWHCGEGDRKKTELSYTHQATVLQGGVIFFKNTNLVKSAFNIWRVAWHEWKDQDQGALLRALYQFPLRVWLLGRPWNGGAVIGHNHGRARRGR